MRTKLGLALASLLLIAFASAPSPVQAAPPTTAAVTIVDFNFNPHDVNILFDEEGNSVTFHYVAEGFIWHEPKNDPHNDNFEGACLDSGGLIFPDQTVTIPITWTTDCVLGLLSVGAVWTGGLYIPYHCHQHPGMTGNIYVQFA